MESKMADDELPYENKCPYLFVTKVRASFQLQTINKVSIWLLVINNNEKTKGTPADATWKII